MDKIPGTPPSKPSEPQPEASTVANKGKLGSKQVSSADPNAYLDKTASKTTSDQTLGNRQITADAIKMINTLAQKKKWNDVVQKICEHAQTGTKLDELLASVNSQVGALPSEAQQEIGKHYENLLAKEITPGLIEGLTE